jgi:uncharacterized repeat protein (TIGR01451 family)
MSIRTSFGLRTAFVAVAAIGWSMGANAQTAAGISIANTATVDYTVGGLAQAPIESSPTGNTTPGAGAGTPTAFLVDNRVDLTVAEVGAIATITTPGAVDAVLTYTVLNSGNAPQGYAFTLAEETTGSTFPGGNDNADFGLASLQVRVDDGDGIYDAGDIATAIDTLNAGASATVFVVAPSVPLILLNGYRTNIRLQAQTAVPGTGGGTLETESLGVNDPTTIEVLFADTGGDATESAADQFLIQSAAVTVTKTQTVLDDGFGSASPRAIPLAFVEYTIAVTNTGLSPADGISISDPIPATTTFQTGSYGGGDVQITGGLTPTCVAETGADTNTDGCFRNGTGDLVVDSTALGNILPGGSRTVQFTVRIN